MGRGAFEIEWSILRSDSSQILSQLLRFESSVSPHPEVHRENELLSSKLANKPIALFSYFLPMPVRSSKNTIWGGLFFERWYFRTTFFPCERNQWEKLLSVLKVLCWIDFKKQKRDSDGVKDSQNRHLELSVVKLQSTSGLFKAVHKKVWKQNEIWAKNLPTLFK